MFLKKLIVGLPPAASFSRFGPPGYGSPKTRAILSNASPAASSLVPPMTSNSVYPRTATSEVCPPLAAKHKNGGLSSG